MSEKSAVNSHPSTGDKNHPLLLLGNEAVALAALDAGVALGSGYPGTPSTEILETLNRLGGRAQWSPNEKVALEVGIGAAFGGASALVTMKHVGLNVAADPLFTSAYSGISPGAMVVAVADDPGMASSQNEQDSRRYALAAGVPMLEPADAQECYDMTREAMAVSRRWGLPVLLRLTTRVSHSKSIVRRGERAEAPATHFDRNIAGRVMIPAHARPAHGRLRKKLAEVAEWAEGSALNQVLEGGKELGVVTSGVCALHVREAAPEASVLKLGVTYPVPVELVRKFAAGVQRCVVVEENDPYLVEQLRTAGIAVEDKPAAMRFGELNVARVRAMLLGGSYEEPVRGGKPPQLCQGCPHRAVFEVLRDLKCIVAGDIGCYTLGALPPFEAMDSQLCMGASLGVGLGLRHVLPEGEAKRVVSVIGDSTFMHSGLTGLAEMVYNPPKTGHVLIILDNSTTAMTGLQEHPGTGRTLGHTPTGRIAVEEVARAMGMANVRVVDAGADKPAFAALLSEALAAGGLWVIVARRPCILAAGKVRQYEKAAAEGRTCAEAGDAE